MSKLRWSSTKHKLFPKGTLVVKVWEPLFYAMYYPVAY
jgi:hypothetical protein